MLRIVHTGCGAIEGIAAPEPEITVFRGIPFAAPPETRTVPTRTARRCRNGHGTPRSAATPCGWVSGPV